MAGDVEEEIAPVAERLVCFSDSKLAEAINESATQLMVAMVRERQLVPAENEHRYSHGGVWTTAGADDVPDTTLHEMSSEWAIGYRDIVEQSLSKVLGIITRAAVQMSDEQTQMLFDKVIDACDRTGNTVDRAGKPRHEAILESLRKIEFGVGRDGKVSGPSIYMSDGRLLDFEALIEMQPPEHRDELRRLFAIKSEQALAREAERLARFPKWAGQ